MLYNELRYFYPTEKLTLKLNEPLTVTRYVCYGLLNCPDYPIQRYGEYSVETEHKPIPEPMDHLEAAKSPFYREQYKKYLEKFQSIPLSSFN